MLPHPPVVPHLHVNRPLMSKLSMIIWVNTVLNRTVVDSTGNCCFNNVCRSHLQSHAQVVEMSVTVNNSPIQDYIHPIILNLILMKKEKYRTTKKIERQYNKEKEINKR